MNRYISTRRQLELELGLPSPCSGGALLHAALLSSSVRHTRCVKLCTREDNSSTTSSVASEEFCMREDMASSSSSSFLRSATAASNYKAEKNGVTVTRIKRFNHKVTIYWRKLRKVAGVGEVEAIRTGSREISTSPFYRSGYFTRNKCCI